MIDDDIWEECYIEHDVSTPYEDIKNHIIVIGGTHDVQNYPEKIILTGDTYVCECANVTALEEDLKLGFTTTKSGNENISNPHLDLNYYGSRRILNPNGSTAQLENDTYYVLRYKNDDYFGEHWVFLGEVTPMAESVDDNPQSPFYINGTIGDIKIVLSGGEYDNITSYDLAKQRADWELYTRCKLQDSITIKSVPLYWADVNWLINITLPNEDESQLYIIKDISIDGGIGSSQTLKCMKYYSFYEQGE